MPGYTTYDPITGIPFSWSHGDGLPAPEPGHLWLEGAWPADDWRIVDGEPMPWEPGPEEAARALAEARAEAHELADELIGAARRLFITEIPGQQLIYLRKEADAKAYLADPAPDLANHRFVRVDALRFGITGHEAAQIILNKAAMFETLAEAMEAIRGAAHDAIDAAATAEAAQEAVATAREDLFLLLSSYGGVAVEAPG